MFNQQTSKQTNKQTSKQYRQTVEDYNGKVETSNSVSSNGALSFWVNTQVCSFNGFPFFFYRYLSVASLVVTDIIFISILALTDVPN